MTPTQFTATIVAVLVIIFGLMWFMIRQDPPKDEVETPTATSTEAGETPPDVLPSYGSNF